MSLSITTILFFLLTKCFIIVTLFLFPFPSIILLAFPSNSRSLSNHFHISLNDYHQYINTHTYISISISIFTYIRSSVKRLLSHQITCRVHVDIKPTGLSKLMNILFEMILYIYREREDLNNLHNTNVKIYYDFKNKSWYFYLYEEEEEEKMRAIKYLKRKWQK